MKIYVDLAKHEPLEKERLWLMLSYKFVCLVGMVLL